MVFAKHRTTNNVGFERLAWKSHQKGTKQIMFLFAFDQISNFSLYLILLFKKLISVTLFSFLPTTSGNLIIKKFLIFSFIKSSI